MPNDEPLNDETIDELRDFWGALKRKLASSPNVDQMTDLLGEYRHLAQLIDDDDDPEHREMLARALAIRDS
jgi:hypothetical protein